jgi:TldD protein
LAEGGVVVCFKQSVCAVNLKYLKNDFDYYVKFSGGMRKEHPNFTDVVACDSLFSGLDELPLNFSLPYLKKLQQLLKSKKSDLSRQNIEFFVYLKLHNEKVQIDDVKEDMRSFGYIRLVLKKYDNVFMEDLPIIEADPPDLDEKICDYIKKIQKTTSFLEQKGLRLPRSQQTLSRLKPAALPVVLSPQSAGYFIHEILGHTMEGDFYSFYKNRYENLKISPILTVRDSVEGFAFLAGIDKYDDDGTKTKPLTLIDGGKICNVLATKKIDSFDNKLYGVARRENYCAKTMPRMRGTYISPCANVGLRDILNKYSEAIYMEKAYAGGVDLQTGNYFVSGYGFIAGHGEFQKFIGKLKISGNIFKSLSSFDCIGNDFKVYGSYCIKLGQCVRVGTGGPTVSLFDLTAEGDVY